MKKSLNNKIEKLEIKLKKLELEQAIYNEFKKQLDMTCIMVYGPSSKFTDEDKVDAILSFLIQRSYIMDIVITKGE